MGREFKYYPEGALESGGTAPEKKEQTLATGEIASASVVDLQAYRAAKVREAFRSDRVEEAKEAAEQAAANERPDGEGEDSALDARLRGIEESDRQTRARMEMWEAQGSAMPEADMRGLISDLHADDLVDFTADDYFAAWNDKRRLLGLQGSKRDAMNRKIEAEYKKLEWGIDV